MQVRKHAGFTLLQLLLALAVIGILAVLSIPTFTETIQNQRLKGAAESLYQTMQLARTEAVKQRNDTYVTVQVGSNWCFGANVGSSCNCSVSGNCALGAISSSDYPNTSINLTGLTSNSAVFDGVRALAANAGAISFSSNGNTLTIDVNRMGRVRICSSDLVGYKSCT